MNRVAWPLVVCVSALAGCASEPRYPQPVGEVAYLQNGARSQGQARFTYYFEYVNGLDVSPSEWSLSMPVNARSEIEPGEIVVGVQVVYTPAYGRNLIARMNDRLFYIFVRDLGFTDERLDYIVENSDGVDADSLSGLQGLRFNAVAGKTYQAAARIENGRALVWIEDEDGTVVSDTVTGVTDPYCAADVAAGTYHCNANLRHGWAILDNLPDPRP